MWKVERDLRHSGVARDAPRCGKCAVAAGSGSHRPHGNSHRGGIGETRIRSIRGCSNRRCGHVTSSQGRERIDQLPQRRITTGGERRSARHLRRRRCSYLQSGTGSPRSRRQKTQSVQPGAGQCPRTRGESAHRNACGARPSCRLPESTEQRATTRANHGHGHSRIMVERRNARPGGRSILPPAGLFHRGPSIGTLTANSHARQRPRSRNSRTRHCLGCPHGHDG